MTLDTVRADHVGCYGYFRDTTPQLDRLARESLLFENCSVPVAMTLPSHMSLFTGLYPIEHGIEANVANMEGSFIPAPGVETLAAHLAAAGYATAGFVSASPVKAGTGLEAGFETWWEPEANQARARAPIDQALAWLATDPPQPYFLWVHLFDAHGPYDPPPRFAELFGESEAQRAYLERLEFPERFPRVREHDGVPNDLVRVEHDHYDGEIRYADTQFGRLLRKLERRSDWRRTAVVVTTDHGEGLGQHGQFGHQGLWKEQLDAVLVVRVPGRAGQRLDVPIENRDLLPTLQGLLPELPLGDLLEQCSGRDVLAAEHLPGARFWIAPPDPLRERHDGPFRQPLRAVEADGWRLIRYNDGDELLFHLDEDPTESTDLAEREPAKLAELGELLERLEAGQRERRERLGAGRIGPMSPERLRALEALGYAGGREQE